jgi:hypothetical protein
MIMKRVILVLAVLVMVAPILQSCSWSLRKVESGEIHHIIIVWLKNPGNEEDTKFIIDASRKLRSIPGVKTIEIGQVVKSDRKIVDSSYDVAVKMTFSSIENMHKYLSHPDHVRLAKEVLMPKIKKIKVFDYKEVP